MNHFELFDLPEALDIDLATLKANFLTLQQQYHPDKAEDQLLDDEDFSLDDDF